MFANKRFIECILTIAIAFGLAGCGSSSSSNSPSGGSSMDQMASAVGAQNAAAKKAEEDRQAEEARKAAEAAKTPPPPQIEVVTAHSMKKGKSLEGGGYLSVVTGAKFWAEHQIILDNILYAVKLYEAEHGEYPKTQEQYMTEIIKKNEPSTRLPELPEGWEYFYDPKDPLELKMINKGGSGDPSAVQ